MQNILPFVDFYRTYFPLINFDSALMAIKSYKIPYSFLYLSQSNYQWHIYYTSGSITSHFWGHHISLFLLTCFLPYLFHFHCSLLFLIPPVPSLLCSTALLLADGKLSTLLLSISTNITSSLLYGVVETSVLNVTTTCDVHGVKCDDLHGLSCCWSRFKSFMRFLRGLMLINCTITLLFFSTVMATNDTLFFAALCSTYWWI